MRATHFINWQIELEDDIVYPVVVTFPAQLPLTVEVKMSLLILHCFSQRLMSLVPQ